MKALFSVPKRALGLLAAMALGMGLMGASAVGSEATGPEESGQGPHRFHPPRFHPQQQMILPGPIFTVSGEVIQGEELMGKVVLINAWATWCGPCVREMPAFQRVLDEFQDQGFFVLGISADTVGAETVKAYVDDLGIRYPVTVGLQPTLGFLTRQVMGLPTSFLLDREGQVSQKVEGVFDEESLRAAVEALLKDPLREEDSGLRPGPPVLPMPEG